MASTVELLEKISAQNQVIARLEAKLASVGSETFSSRARLGAFESAVSMMPQFFYWINNEGFVQAINHDLCKWLGQASPSTVSGLNLYEMLADKGVPSGQISLLKGNDRIVQSTKSTCVFEEKICHKGQNFVFLSYKRPLTDAANKSQGIVCISYDITERYQHESSMKQVLEDQQKEHLHRMTFLSKSRHDIRTPLANLIGLAEILMEGECSELVKDMYHSAKQLDSMISQLLDFAQKQCFEESMTLEVFSFPALIEEIEGAVRVLTREKNIRFVTKISEGHVQVIRSSRVRLQRIIMNLVVNAIHHARTEYIEVSAFSYEQNGKSFLKLTVLDHGIGIPSSHQEAVLSGQRIIAGEVSEQAGEGLGLSIINDYVQDLDGLLELSSQVGVGTQFIVTIPFEAVFNGVDTESLAC